MEFWKNELHFNGVSQINVESRRIMKYALGRGNLFSSEK